MTKLRKRNRLIYGFGINDADYAVAKKIDGILVVCPFYRSWSHMLERGYSEKYKIKKPTYSDVSVCDEWKYFSNFKEWMKSQDWEGKQLDKDILLKGNKIYSPDGCSFLPSDVNSLLNDCSSIRGDSPLGVSYYSVVKKYVARAWVDGKSMYLGHFESKYDAHREWQKTKADNIERVANKQANERIKNALMLRVYQLRDDILNNRETIKL